MKKVLCFLLALALLCGAALAENRDITGSVTLKGDAYTVDVLLGEAGFEANIKGASKMTVQGVRQSDGTMLLGDGSGKALLVSLVSLDEMLNPVISALDEEPAYEDAVYSSKYIQAQQVQMSAAEVAAFALTVLNACPFLSTDEALYQSLKQVGGGETWATVTRYVADQRQYPNDWLLRVNVFSPLLPAIYAEVRSDEFGSSFTLAASRAKVTDWDETIAAISENAAEGALVKGFTLVDAGTDVTNTYLEVDICYQGGRYLLVVDRDVSNDNAGQWTASVALTDGADAEVAAAELSCAPAKKGPAPQVKYTTLVDGTDGLTESERAQLGY